MENIQHYDSVVTKMRAFFKDKYNFVEVPAQSRRSILAACEDPKTISQYIFAGVNWPLPQTGQMWLEHELLKNPQLDGVFCVTTSYRNEPNPIPGRHDTIFPMFEFEAQGGMADMIHLEEELLEHLGFGDTGSFPHVTYNSQSNKYDAPVLEAEHEEKIQVDQGDAVFLTDFPERTHPFWNMKYNPTTDLYNKCDVLLCGIETIGSAERETDVNQMRERFRNISNGEYASLLYNHFGQERVDAEMDEYLSNNMFERFGGGIGVTRMARAMKLKGLI